MRKICEDAFYGLNYIGFREKLKVLEMLNCKSLFRYDGVNMKYESEKLEDKLKEFMNQDVLLVNNGTAALKLCLIANGIGYGDEVIVPCLSFIATAATCLSVGAIPVFADINDTFNIDPKSVEKNITNKTKAIIAVHYQGYPCQMDELKKICKKYNLRLIEDVAQAFGAKYKNALLGTFGDSAAFSFQSCKVITCGEGGAVTSKINMDKINRYADNGGERLKDEMPRWDKIYISFGENFKITDMQSAILGVQFKKLNKIISNQTKIYRSLINNLKGYNFRMIPDSSKVIYMSLCIIFENEKQCINFINYMKNKEIPFTTKKCNFLPKYNTFMSNTSPYKNSYPYEQYKVNECKKSYILLNRSAWLTLNSKLSKKQIKYIRRNMVDYYEKFYN